jgi:hypothetical protein
LQSRKTNDPILIIYSLRKTAMNDTIEITESNYKGYCAIDIVAFSFAQPGAMGEPGGVEIIDAQGWFYHTNYCYRGVSYDQLKEIVPILKDCKIGIAGQQEPEGWKAAYLGFGNHLFIKAEYYNQFDEEVRKRHIEEAVELYQQWYGIVMNLCKTKH